MNVLLTLLLVLAWTLSAQKVVAPSQTELVDGIFKEWDSTVSPGCALSVMKAGQIVYKRGYGMADLDHDVPIRPDSVFHVASVSKQFTATAIVLLALERKLSLDDNVRKYIAELPDFGTPITIRHLIHHTSGLRDQWDLLDLAGWRYSLDLITDSDVLDLISKQRDLNFKPGDEHVYCNTGYTLLAQIVKRVSGQSFREFTTQRIFEPLGMKNTHFRDDHAEIVKHQALGYSRSKDGFRLSLTNFDTVGATSLLTTVEDLALWDENFYSPKIGGKALIEQQLQRGKLNNGEQLDYAFGLGWGKYRGLPTVGHAGSDAGYRAALVRFPEQHFSVACLCNLAGTNPSDLARKVSDVYLANDLKEPEQWTVPSTDKPITLSDAQRSRYVGLYWNRKDEQAMMITLKEGKLFSGHFNQKYELTPLATDRFRVVGQPVEIAFDHTLSDAPFRLLFKADGSSQSFGGAVPKPQIYEADSEFKPTIVQLNDYAGAYRSEEIDSVYRIVVEENGLVLKRLKSAPAQLTPEIKDFFQAGVVNLHFLRDAKGNVSDLLLNTGRIRNFQFRKERTDVVAR